MTLIDRVMGVANIAFAPADEGQGGGVPLGDPPADEGAGAGQGADQGEGDQEKQALSDEGAGESQGDEGDKSEGEGDGEKAAADQVPEDGVYKLTMPEGVEVDQAMLDALGPEFKEAGLTNAQAQKLADKYVTIMQERIKQAAEAKDAAAVQESAAWLDQAQKDQEIGGDNWQETVRLAVQGVEKFATPGLKELFERQGLGNHPEMIRHFRMLGKMASEDQPTNESNQGKAEKDPASVLFPNDVPKG